MSVWDGNWLWIWQASAIGNVNYIRDKAKEMGLDGVLVKAHDGDLSTGPSRTYMKQFKEIITPFKDAGLRVAAWGYLYGYNPQGEADAAVEAIRAGADWYVIDAEIEFEPSHRPEKENIKKAKEFCAALNEKYPDIPKGFTSFAIPQYHPLPYHIFAEYVDVMMPQVYWHAIGWGVDETFEKSYNQWEEFGLPVSPVGQAYGGSPLQEMERFTDLAVNKGCAGISWWDWQHATKEQLEVIGMVSNKFVQGDDIIGKFKDLDGHWAQETVEKAHKLGLVSGKTDDTFAPDQNLTRAEGVVLLMRLYDILQAR